MKTKGEWKLREVREGDDEVHFINHTDEYQIMSEDGTECIATMGTAWANGRARANAHLIVTAVNACAQVNPDNPMAVAEAIEEMYEALKGIRERTRVDCVVGEARVVLSKSIILRMTEALAKGR